jgi:hypothetical protein
VASHAALLAAAALALPAPTDSPHLWTTVNICDTERHPDTFGVRASMPGSGSRRESMWMRFEAQWRTADGEWRRFSSDALDSGWIRVARTSRRLKQSGYSFRFRTSGGRRFVLRGRTRFEWRRGRRVVRRASETTVGGVRPTVADPRRYSAATCEIG